MTFRRRVIAALRPRGRRRRGRRSRSSPTSSSASSSGAGSTTELRRDVTETFAVPLLSSSHPPRLEIRRDVEGGRPALVPAANAGRRRGRSPLPARAGRSVAAASMRSWSRAMARLIRPRGPRTDLPGCGRAGRWPPAKQPASFTDVEAFGSHLRVYTAQIEPGRAIQVARPLDEVDDTLQQLAVILLLVSLGGIALAGGLGLFVSRAAVAPVERLRRAAEQVATTRDLSRRIESTGNDEIAALASSFNLMLNALESSLDAQRQLVADASHELRTPLASMRTNIEVLTHSDLIAERRTPRAARRRRLPARGADRRWSAISSTSPATPSTSSSRRRWSASTSSSRRSSTGVRPRGRTVEFELDASPTRVWAVERGVERAVSNLLDNAVKWSPPGATVEVRVADGRGLGPRPWPGDRRENDLPHVFDRFYRSTHGPRSAGIRARAGDRAPGRRGRRRLGRRRERRGRWRPVGAAVAGRGRSGAGPHACVSRLLRDSYPAQRRLSTVPDSIPVWRTAGVAGRKISDLS